MKKIALLLILCVSPVDAQERINHTGRILGDPLPVASATLFNTASGDQIVASLQIMPRDNPWNEDIANAPLLANSAAMIAQISSDLPTDRQELRPFFEMNYVLVPSDQAEIPISFFYYSNESDPSPYPIPSNMPVEGWPVTTGSLTLEQWQEDINDYGGDRHSIIVQPASGLIWETWLTKRVGSSWQASNGARFDMNSNGLRPDGWTSADAAGLPMFPGLVRYDECQRGEVEHAIRMIVDRTRREYIYPATHFASTTPASEINVPAMGQRLRLPSGFVIPGHWSRESKAVARALQKYGGIVADNGGFLSLSVSPDDRFAEGVFEDLREIAVDDFEVVQTTGPDEGPRSPGVPSADAGEDLSVHIATGALLQGSAAGSNLSTLWYAYPYASQPGNVTFSNPGALTTRASFAAEGTYTLMFKAEDGIHTPAYDAAVITVHANGNAPPTAYDQNLSLFMDGSLAFTLTGDDPEGQPLTYHILSQPVNGDLTGNPPNLTYTARKGYRGSDSFTFVVRDEESSSYPATIALSVLCRPGDCFSWPIFLPAIIQNEQ